jgi:hypothetical protein
MSRHLRDLIHRVVAGPVDADAHAAQAPLDDPLDVEIEALFRTHDRLQAIRERWGFGL